MPRGQFSARSHLFLTWADALPFDWASEIRALAPDASPDLIAECVAIAGEIAPGLRRQAHAVERG